jgi:hypothetical protein
LGPVKESPPVPIFLRLTYLLRVILKSKHNNLTKQTKMKKVIAIFAIATTLVACGGNASTEATATDSTAVDSTVVAVDSAAVVADTTAVAPAEVK